MKQEGLLGRILKMSVAVGLFVTVFILSLGRVWEAVSYAIGAVVSVSFFVVLELAIIVGLRPEVKRRTRVLLALLAVAKYGLVGWLIVALLRWPYAQMGFFLAGATTVPAVIVLKALGQLLADATAEKR